MAILSPSQTRMLRLTVEAGYCLSQQPSKYRSAWVVIRRGIPLTFAQATGDALVALKFIEPDAASVSASRDFIVSVYLPTAAGIAHVSRRRPSPKNTKGI